jgi:hypothetical protein
MGNPPESYIFLKTEKMFFEGDTAGGQKEASPSIEPPVLFHSINKILLGSTETIWPGFLSWTLPGLEAVRHCIIWHPFWRDAIRGGHLAWIHSRIHSGICSWICSTLISSIRIYSWICSILISSIRIYSKWIAALGPNTGHFLPGIGLLLSWLKLACGRER